MLVRVDISGSDKVIIVVVMVAIGVVSGGLKRL